MHAGKCNAYYKTQQDGKCLTICDLYTYKRTAEKWIAVLRRAVLLRRFHGPTGLNWSCFEVRLVLCATALEAGLVYYRHDPTPVVFSTTTKVTGLVPDTR